MADEGSETVAKLIIDVSQPQQVPGLMAGVGAAVEKALGGIDAGAKATSAELKLMTAALQKSVVETRGVEDRRTAIFEEASSKRLAIARSTAQTTLEIDRAAIAELLQAQKAADDQALAQLKATIKKKQNALDAGQETRARKQRAQIAFDLQQARLDAGSTSQTSKQDHQKGLQDTKLLAQSATTQANILAKTQIANSNNVTKVTIANAKNAAAVQIATINQVTAANNAAARSALSLQQAQQAQTLQTQKHVQRYQLTQLQQQGRRQGPGGMLASLGQAGGAIYAVKTVVSGLGEVVAATAEMSKLSTAYQRQTIASKNLAGGVRNLDELMDAYTKATGGAVDKVTSLQDVTRLQAIGFADNADELERFVRAARGISLAVGKDMAEVTQEVALTIANQSTRRLDQIGLGVEEVNERIETLRETNKGMTREMAFSEAVLQIAGEKYGGLTDAVEAQATGVEKLTAVWKDFGLALANLTSGPINAIAKSLSDQIQKDVKDLENLKKRIAELSSYTIPNGVEAPTTLSQAQTDRDMLQSGLAFQREQLASGSGPSDLPVIIAETEESLRKLNITIAGINAKISLATGSYDQPLAGGVSGGQPRKEAQTGLGLSMDQYKVLYDAEQDRLDMEAGISKQILDETTEYNEQRAKTIADYEKQISRDAEDFARQRQQAQADHEKAMADVVADGLERQAEMAEDLADRIARATRDSADRVAEINEDYGRKVAEMREDSSDKIKDMEEDAAEDELKLKEDSAKKIAEMEEDFAKDRKQNLRDYNDSVISAAASLDAKAVWEAQRRFARENAEAEEAHEEKVNEEKESLAEALKEQTENLAKKRKAEEESLTKSIDKATEMRDEQIDDENKALAKRNEDARTAHAEQLQDAINKDAQRLIDMQTDFNARIQKENDDHDLRMGRMQTDHEEQMTELGTQHTKRLTQIGEQASEERKAFDESYTDRLQDAEIFTTAWALQQAAAEEESLKIFKKLFDGMNEVMGKVIVDTPNSISPIVANYKEELIGRRNMLVGQLDDVTSPEEYDRITALINWINEQLGLIKEVTGPKLQSVIDGSGNIIPATAPAVGRISGLGGVEGMSVVIEAGAIVISPLPGQSAASVGDEFERRLLETLRKVGKQ